MGGSDAIYDRLHDQHLERKFCHGCGQLFIAAVNCDYRIRSFRQRPTLPTEMRDPSILWLDTINGAMQKHQLEVPVVKRNAKRKTRGVKRNDIFRNFVAVRCWQCGRENRMLASPRQSLDQHLQAGSAVSKWTKSGAKEEKMALVERLDTFTMEQLGGAQASLSSSTIITANKTKSDEKKKTKKKNKLASLQSLLDNSSDRKQSPSSSNSLTDFLKSLK